MDYNCIKYIIRQNVSKLSNNDLIDIIDRFFLV